MGAGEQGSRGAGETRYVVGIDVAKQTHVVCALEAPGGAIWLKPSQIAASAAGYARLHEWLQNWAGPQGPEAMLIGMEATGTLWEPLYDTLAHAGYQVQLLNPRPTASWAASLGLRAKTDGIDAHTLARGLLAGLARPSTLPSETIQALRALTRARRDLVQTRAAARQRLHDELVVLFPEFVPLLRQVPGAADLGTPAVLHLLEADPGAAALAQAADEAVLRVVERASDGRWGAAEAALLQQVARRSAASTRAVAARGLVVRTFVGQVLHLHQQIAELEAAIQEVLRDDADSRQLQGIPGIGPQGAATIRAELGDVTRFSRVDEVVADAGLDPRTCQSGAFVGQKHLSKRCPSAAPVRYATPSIWQPSWPAGARPSGACATSASSTRAAGSKKEAFTILSRALLRVISHLLRTGEAYDPTLLNQPAPAPVG
jgi:transposase